MVDRDNRRGHAHAAVLVLGLLAAPVLSLWAAPAAAQDHMAGKWATTDFGRYDVPAEEIAQLCSESYEQHYEDGTFIAFDLADGTPVITLVGTCAYAGPDVTCTYQADNIDGPIMEVYTDRLKRIDQDTIGLTVLDDSGRPDPEFSWTYHRCVGG